jgi:hypothetical protein
VPVLILKHKKYVDTSFNPFFKGNLVRTANFYKVQRIRTVGCLLCCRISTNYVHSYCKHQLRAQSRQSAKPFLQSSELGLPHPLTRRQVCPPLVPGGWAHSLVAERGWGSPNSANSDEETNTVVLFINMYFVVKSKYLYLSGLIYSVRQLYTP